MLSASPVAAVIAVNDLEQARKFYSDTLGLKVHRDLPPGGIFYETGAGTKLLVYRRPDHQPSAATVAAFDVTDLKGEVAALTTRGVVFEDYDMPGIKTDADHIATLASGTPAAWFKDPEGNILSMATV